MEASHRRRVPNRRITRARERLGHKTQRSAAAAVGVAYETFVRFENGQKPVDTEGSEWLPAAVTIAEGLYVMPEDLWPVASRRLCRMRRQVEATSEQMRDAPAINGEEALATLRDIQHVRTALNVFSERNRDIILDYFGGEATAEIAGRLGRSRTRIHQIVDRAVRELARDLLRPKLEPVEVKEALIAAGMRRAVCDKCKRNDSRVLLSEEGKDGARVYSCDVCSRAPRPAAPTEAENQARREQSLPRLLDVPGAYAVPHWETRVWEGFGLMDLAQDYKDQDLLRAAKATPGELAHWVETGEIPERCRALQGAG